MTQEITAIEVLKSKQNFSVYIENHSDEIISEIMEGYPKRNIHTILSQLTQSDEGLLEGVQNLTSGSNGYFFWFTVNTKDRHLEIASKLNKSFTKNYGIFVIQTYLNEDKIDFKCLLKPEIPTKTTRNENTPAKLLQNEYWEQYFQICDELQSKMQVTPAPRHYQYIPIKKTGVQIMQTINTKGKYIATEIMINSRKDIFNGLLEYKEKIEEELGKLEWHSLENNKSSRIRKYLNIDFENPEHIENAIKTHIKMAEDFNNTFSEYLK